MRDIAISQQSNSVRNQNVDLIKIIAMFGVIMLHTTRSFINGHPWSVASAMYKSAVVSIPLFFMVSGFLLFQRKNITYRYVFAKILKIFRYILVFVVGLWILKSMRHGFNLNALIVDIWNSLNAKGEFYVFWYFGALMLVYLLLPLIIKVFNSSNLNAITLAIICLTIQSIFFTINIITGIEKINPDLRIYNWLTYSILGGVLRG